jgi:hypothetical protein
MSEGAKMQSESFRSLFKPMETVHRIIWIAYVAAIPAYVCVAYMFFGATADVTPALSNPLTIPLVILSLLNVVLAPYIPRFLLSDSRLRQMLDRQPDTETILSPDEQRLRAIVPAFFVGFILRLAFNEAIALYGLVLAFISKSFVAVLPFAIVSFALNWMVPLPLDEAVKRIARLGVE